MSENLKRAILTWTILCLNGLAGDLLAEESDPSVVLGEAIILQHEDPDAALLKLDAAIDDLAQPKQVDLLELLFVRAGILRNLGRMDEALADAAQMASLALEPDYPSSALALYVRGTVWHELGRSADALEAFHESRRLLLESEVQDRLARVIMAIAIIHTDLGEYERGREYYQRALEVARGAGDRNTEMYVLGNLGHVVNESRGPEESLEYHEAALILSQETGNDTFGAYQLSSACDRLFDLNRLDAAEQRCSSALTLAQKIGHARLQGFTHLSLGNILERRGEVEQSLANYEDALRIGEDIGRLLLVVQSHERLAALEERRGNYDDALGHLKQMLSAQDRLRLQERQEAIDALELQFQAREREQRIQVLQLETELQDQLIARRNYLLLVMGITLVIVGSLTGFIWRGYRITVGLERKLAERNQALQESVTTIGKLADEDPLTGLRNRRAFYALADHELARSKRARDDLTLVLFDIDEFKLLNDRYGHAIGDEVLKEVANRLQLCTRDVDILCRWGGEEFVMLLPDTHVEGGRLATERVRKHLKEAIETEAGEVRVSATFGIAPVTDDLETAIRNADVLMYEGKQAGRDRIVMYAAHPEPFPSG